MIENVAILKEILLNDSLKYNKEIIFNIIPELRNEEYFDQKSEWHDKNVWDHTISVVNACEYNFILRLALLLHDIGKPHTMVDDDKGRHFPNHALVSSEMAYKILNQLELDKNVITKIVWLIANHATRIDTNLINDDNINDYEDLLKVQICDAKGYEEKHTAIALNNLFIIQKELIKIKEKKRHGR